MNHALRDNFSVGKPFRHIWNLSMLEKGDQTAIADIPELKDFGVNFILIIGNIIATYISDSCQCRFI